MKLNKIIILWLILALVSVGCGSTISKVEGCSDEFNSDLQKVFKEFDSMIKNPTEQNVFDCLGEGNKEIGSFFYKWQYKVKNEKEEKIYSQITHALTGIGFKVIMDVSNRLNSSDLNKDDEDIVQKITKKEKDPQLEAELKSALEDIIIVCEE